jgi:hypothetical protein
MSDYILPDEYLQWTSNNGVFIENSAKYTISYENGRHAQAQSGGNTRQPSRISTLTIHSLTVSDNGKFICTIHGTTEFIIMDLEVNDTPRDTSKAYTWQAIHIMHPNL